MTGYLCLMILNSDDKTLGENLSQIVLNMQYFFCKYNLTTLIMKC